MLYSKEELYQLYVVEQIGPYELAKRVNRHAKTIYYLIDKYKIPRQIKNPDITGKIIGNLEVIKKVGQRKNKTFIWECKTICCNRKCIIDTWSINNKTIRCCIKTENGYKRKLGKYRGNWKGVESLSGNKWHSIICRAKYRNISWNLTKEEAYSKFNGSCSLTGLPISFEEKTASLDRIDSSLGYQIDNVWWVHKDINLIKNTFSVNKFLEVCNLVVNPLKIEYENKNKVSLAFWSNVIYNAKKRKIKVDITREQALELFFKQKFRCAITGQYIHLELRNYKTGSNRTASLDRIDNSIGYKIDNIQWVHKDINQSRKHLSIEKYFELCKLVVDFKKV